MFLPLNVLAIINKYSKPVTRPDWRSNPKFSFKQFFYGIQKTNKFTLRHFYYKVIMGYSHYYILDKYTEIIKSGYNRVIALTKIQTEYGLDPQITILMCNIDE